MCADRHARACEHAETEFLPERSSGPYRMCPLFGVWIVLGLGGVVRVRFAHQSQCDSVERFAINQDEAAEIAIPCIRLKAERPVEREHDFSDIVPGEAICRLVRRAVQIDPMRDTLEG